MCPSQTSLLLLQPRRGIGTYNALPRAARHTVKLHTEICTNTPCYVFRKSVIQSAASIQTWGSRCAIEVANIATQKLPKIPHVRSFGDAELTAQPGECGRLHKLCYKGTLYFTRRYIKYEDMETGKPVPFTFDFISLKIMYMIELRMCTKEILMKPAYIHPSKRTPKCRVKGRIYEQVPKKPRLFLGLGDWAFRLLRFIRLLLCIRLSAIFIKLEDEGFLALGV